MTVTVRFGVLGPVVASADGSHLHLGPPQQRTVLAVLLLNEGAVTSTDALVEALWADSPPAGAVKTVRTYISRLRTVLGPAGDTIESVARGYVVRVGPDRFDLARFRELTAGPSASAPAPERAERARQALATFRGEPLAGLAGDWAETQRGQLTHLRAAAYESLFTAELEAGRHAEVIAEFPAAIKQFPFRERLRELHITALYRTGLRAEAFAAYRAVQQLLDDELGIEPTAALQDLHRRMLQNDPGPLPVRDEHGEEDEAPAAPEPLTRPAQLIAAPAAFTGRAQELRRAQELLDSAGQGPAIIVISGMGGVGKTSLALHWAHRLAPRYHDGQLYTDLHGYGPGHQPRTPGEVLGSFLHALGTTPADVPEGLEARAAMYRTLTANRELLILLDNAATADQVIELLPGAGRSLVVITSRGTLPALVIRTGAPLLTLQAPDHDEALALFAARAGTQRVHAEPAAAHDIVELSGRLPLALAITAARAAAATHLPLATIAHDLRTTHGTLSAFRLPDAAFDVAAVLSWSYQALADTPAEALRRLALHPGPDLSAEAAASMLARPLPETRDVLAELVAAALLTEHAPGRWVMHDLVRAYGHDLALRLDDETVRRATLHRLLDYYLYAARAADSKLYKRKLPVVPEQPVPGVIGTDAEPAGWFGGEHLAALAALDLAVREGFDRHAWQLAWMLRDYLNRQGLWHHLQTSQQAALAATVRAGDAAAEARTLWGAALAASTMGRYPEAHTHLRRALEIFEKIKDGDGTEHTRILIAGVLDLQGDWLAALEQFARLLELHPPGSDPVGRSRILVGVSWAKTQLGRYAEAAADAREVLGMAADLHPLRVADTWDTLGRAQAGLGDIDAATHSYHQAVELYLRHETPVWAAESLRRLGDVLSRAGLTGRAEKTYRQALALLVECTGPQAARLGTDLEKILTNLNGL